MGTMRKASEHSAQLGLKEQSLSGLIWETHTQCTHTHIYARTLTQKPLKKRNGPPREWGMEVRHRGQEEDRSSKSRHYSSNNEGGTFIAAALLYIHLFISFFNSVSLKRDSQTLFLPQKL